MKKIQIAIDGPASSGKSTVAKIIARNLDLIYLDTGAMYRVATFVALQKETDDAKEIIEFIEKNPISFMNGQKGQEVLMSSENVTEVIRTNEVTNTVSKISAMTEIREFMVAEQQRIAKNGGIIMDGRDIGTVVLPKADLKIFLVASVDERAERRYKEILSDVASEMNCEVTILGCTELSVLYEAYDLTKEYNIIDAQAETVHRTISMMGKKDLLDDY